MLIKSFLIMIFLGIVDEFYLQGKLENLKNKYGLGFDDLLVKIISEKNKNDWITALLIHSFSWTFMIHFPIFYLGGITILHLILSFVINIFVHAILDHLACNIGKISYSTSYMGHLFQITMTFVAFVYFVTPVRTI